MSACELFVLWFVRVLSGVAVVMLGRRKLRLRLAEHGVGFGCVGLSVQVLTDCMWWTPSQ